MNRATNRSRVTTLRRALPCRAWLVLLALTVAGCSKAASTGRPIRVNPHVRLVKVEKRDISRVIGQPGFVYAFEQTSIYPKVSGFIERWKVDIGDLIKKDQSLADIYVPELKAQYEEKKALVELDEVQIQVAESMVDVASSNWKVAIAQVQEAQAKLGKYQADVERWQSEVKRLTGVAAKGLIDAQVLDESRKQLKANNAALDAAQATVVASQANELARKADLEKARTDVLAARARAKVSRTSERRLAALFSYTDVIAPYDGVVVVRNANQGDYVGPKFGDESAPVGGTESVTPTQGTPLYVVARTDIVRVYVDVPEAEANSVKIGTKAHVLIRARNDLEVDSQVTRTSWALQAKSRTLRAEIDLPNPGAYIRPGMYAYGRIQVESKNVQAIPLAAVTEIGNKNCCYVHEDGKAVQTPVQIGLNDGTWVQVFNKWQNGTWVPFTGQEEIILGDLSELSDGQSVVVRKTK